MRAGRSARVRAVAALLALVALLALAACSGGDPAPSGGAEGSSPMAAPPATVAPPAVPGPPGQLISATPLAAPAGMQAWTIAYHSRSADDRDIAVTGLLVAPAQPAPDLPLVSYGHPTTGSADTCVPSQRGLVSLPVPDGFTGRGWALVMTDFEGLGTSDPHPYLVGVSEGQTMLDAARAARQVTAAGVTERSPVGLVGFSQGGHAAAFAGELASTYAPELAVKGVAVAAPVSDVEHFAARAEGLPDQLGVLVTIVGGFAHAYPELDPAAVFTDEATGQLGELERRCIGEINVFFDRPPEQVVRIPATVRPDFRARFAENQAGNRPLPVPALVVQGDADPIISPGDSQALAARWCALGTPVEQVTVPGAGHGVMAEQPFADWLSARFAGQAPPAGC